MTGTQGSIVMGQPLFWTLAAVMAISLGAMSVLGLLNSALAYAAHSKSPRLDYNRHFHRMNRLFGANVYAFVPCIVGVFGAFLALSLVFAERVDAWLSATPWLVAVVQAVPIGFAVTIAFLCSARLRMDDLLNNREDFLLKAMDDDTGGRRS